MDSEPVGRILALSTLKALKDIKTEEPEMSDIQKSDTKISVINETIELPRRTDIPMLIEMLKEEQRELLKSLRGTSLNFKTFLPLYIKYALNPDYPSDYSYKVMGDIPSKITIFKGRFFKNTSYVNNRDVFESHFTF